MMKVREWVAFLLAAIVFITLGAFTISSYVEASRKPQSLTNIPGQTLTFGGGLCIIAASLTYAVVWFAWPKFAAALGLFTGKQ